MTLGKNATNLVKGLHIKKMSYSNTVVVLDDVPVMIISPMRSFLLGITGSFEAPHMHFAFDFVFLTRGIANPRNLE